MPSADLKINLINKYAEAEIKKLWCELKNIRDVLTDHDCCYTDEMAQDAAASLFINGNHSSNIQFLYDDGGNKINVTVTEVDPVFTSHVVYNITDIDINNWNTAFDKYPTDLEVTGAGEKTIILTLNDGTTLTASFIVDTDTDTNNYPTSLVFDPNTGLLTLSRNGLSDLVTDLSALFDDTDINNYPTALAFDCDTNLLTLSRNGLADITADLSCLVDTEFTLFTLDTVTVDLSGSGTELDPLYADVNISDQTNNSILIFPDGLYVANAIRSGIVYGGIVTWISGYTYNVSAAGYYINYIFHESPNTVVTLSPADGTFDRIDTIGVNDQGQVIVLEGAPSANPGQAPLDPATQLELSIVLVKTGTTQPTINVECIYKENVEWTSLSSNLGRLNPVSTNSPASGVLDIEGTNVVNNDNILFTRSTTFNPTTLYTVLTFNIKSKGSWGNPDRKLILQFENAGVLVGVPVTLGNGNFGFNATNAATYQVVSIPLSSFGIIPSSIVNSFRIKGSLKNGSIGFYIDDICLQGVPVVQPNTGTDEKVKISANDTTAGYLNGKLVAGPAITLTELNDGANETLRISHTDTSSVANLDTSAAQVIDTLTFDTFGHVQTVTTRNLTLADLGYTPSLMRFAVAGEDEIGGTGFRYFDGANEEFWLDNLNEFQVTQNNGSYWLFNPLYSYFAIYAADGGSAYHDAIGNPNESFHQIGARRNGFTKNSDIFIGAHETLGNYIKLEVVTPTYDQRIHLINTGIYIKPYQGEFFVESLDSASTSNVLYYNSTTGKVTYNSAPITYTDEQAQDAVFNAITLNNGLTGTYNDGANTYTGKLGGTLNQDTTITTTGFDFNLVGLPFVPTDFILYYDPITGTLTYGEAAAVEEPCGEITFTVGDPGFPAAGATTYTNSLLIDAGFAVYREEGRQFIGDTVTGITFDNTTGTITFYPALLDEENIIIDFCPAVGSTSGVGEANTASNLGGGLSNFDSKSGVDLRFNTFANSDFDLASNLISIDATLKSNWNTAYNNMIVSGSYSTGTVTLTQQDGGTVIITGLPSADTNFAANNLTLTGNRIHTFGSNTMLFTGSPSSSLLTITQSGTGDGLTITAGNTAYGLYSTGATGVQGNSVNGFAVVGSATGSGVAILGDSISSQAGYFRATPSSTSTLFTVATLQRLTSGTAVDGIGGQLAFSTEAGDGIGYDSNFLVSKWTTAAALTRTSQFEIWGVNSGISARKLALAGSGQLILDNYGDGTFEDSPTFILGAKADGTIVEVDIADLSGGGGGGVTSVNASISGALAVTGGPITSSGTLAFAWQGSTSQYVRGDGSLSTFPSFITGITANNGITANTSTNVQLGGTGSQLLGNTTISTSAFSLTIPSSNSINTLSVTNSGTGRAINASNSGSASTVDVSNGSSGNAVSAISSTGYGISAQSNFNTAGQFVSTNNGTTTVLPVINIQRQTNGTADVGLGLSLDMYVETTTNSGRISNGLISKWTNATDATRTSQFIITGVNSAATQDVLRVQGTGQLVLPLYTTGTSFTGTPVATLQIDASGNVITNSTTSLGGGGGGDGNGIYTGSGSLSGNTVVTQGTSTLTFNGSTTSNQFLSANSSTGTALKGTTTGGGTAVWGETSGNGWGGYFKSVSGNGIEVDGGTGTGIYSHTSTGLVFSGQNTGNRTANLPVFAIDGNWASTNSNETIAKFGRLTSGTAADGISGSIDMNIETTVTSTTANKLISQWSTATHASRRSRFIIQGVDNAATPADLFTLEGTGQAKLNLYTTLGAFTGTTVGYLAHDASGNIISVSGTGGGGGTPAGSNTEVQFNASGSFGASSNFTFDGTLLKVIANSLGTTQVSTKGIQLINTTAAAAGAQQISPALVQTGYGWKTTATAASQEVTFRSFVLPVQGTANPTGQWKIQSAINGGSYSDKLILDSSSDPMYFYYLPTSNQFLATNQTDIGTNNGMFIGYNAGIANTGNEVLAVGYRTARNNTGNEITAYGYDAAGRNPANGDPVSGDYINAFGLDAAWANGGDDVCAFGTASAWYNLGNDVVAIGQSALDHNTATGDFAIGIGTTAGKENSGAHVLHIGNWSGYQNTGSHVINIGYEAGYQATQSNVINLGYRAGKTNTTITNAVNLNPNTNGVTLLFSSLTAQRQITIPDYAGYLGVHPTISGNASKVLAVNSGATGLEWVTMSGGGGSLKIYATLTIGSSTALNTTSANYDYMCDGTADDVQIAAAIAALPAAGGRIILSEGNFNISALIVINKSNVVLEGQGAATTLTLVNSVNSNVINIGDASSSYSNITVRNLAIEGNMANQTTGRGIHVRTLTTNVTIQNCVVKNTKSHNISSDAGSATPLNLKVINNYLDTSNAGANISVGGFDLLVEGNKCLSGSTYNIYAGGGSKTGNIVNGNSCRTSGGYGIYVDSWQSIVSNNTIFNATSSYLYMSHVGTVSGNALEVRNNPTAELIYLASNWPVTVSGNEITILSGNTAAVTCLYANASSCHITGNSFSMETAQAHKGVYINSYHNAVTGNMFYNNTGTGSIGVYLAGGGNAANATISGNTFEGVRTGVDMSAGGSESVAITGNTFDNHIYAVNLGSSDGVTISGNTFNLSEYHVYSNPASGTTINIAINGNKFYSSTKDSVYLGSVQYSSITGNTFRDIGTLTNDTYSVILLTTANGTNYAKYNTITGNSHNSTSTNKPKYGIREASTNDGGNIVTSNIMVSAVTTQISTQHASTVTANNITV